MEVSLAGMLNMLGVWIRRSGLPVMNRKPQYKFALPDLPMLEGRVRLLRQEEVQKAVRSLVIECRMRLGGKGYERAMYVRQQEMADILLGAETQERVVWRDLWRRRPNKVLLGIGDPSRLREMVALFLKKKKVWAAAEEVVKLSLIHI